MVRLELDDRRRALLEFTRRLIALRQRHPALQNSRFLVGDLMWDSQFKDLAWLRPDGTEMDPEDWQKPWIASLGAHAGRRRHPDDQRRRGADLGDGLLLVMNAHHEPITFHFPCGGGGGVAVRGRHGPAPEAGREPPAPMNIRWRPARWLCFGSRWTRSWRAMPPRRRPGSPAGRCSSAVGAPAW